MRIWNKLFGSSPKTDFNALLAQGALLIDVRTPDEYRGGHIKEAINIPLDRLQLQILEIKKKYHVIITCCRSGARSGMAKKMLVAAGLTCYNGGAWQHLNAQIHPKGF